MDQPITKKVEQVEVYREKYDLVEFVWKRFYQQKTLLVTIKWVIENGFEGLISQMWSLKVPEGMLWRQLIQKQFQ